MCNVVLNDKRKPWSKTFASFVKIAAYITSIKFKEHAKLNSMLVRHAYVVKLEKKTRK